MEQRADSTKLDARTGRVLLKGAAEGCPTVFNNGIVDILPK